MSIMVGQCYVLFLLASFLLLPLTNFCLDLPRLPPAKYNTKDHYQTEKITFINIWRFLWIGTESAKSKITCTKMIRLFPFLTEAWVIMCIGIAKLTTVLTKFSGPRISAKTCTYSTLKWFCSIPLGKWVSNGGAIKRCKKKSILYFFFESTVYLKSESMPLIW